MLLYFCDQFADRKIVCRLMMRSVSPQSPLLAGELPPLAPSAYAPSPRKEGEEEENTGGKTSKHTEPHINVMRGERGRMGGLKKQKKCNWGEKSGKTAVVKVVWRWNDWMILYHTKNTPKVKDR